MNILDCGHNVTKVKDNEWKITRIMTGRPDTDTLLCRIGLECGKKCSSQLEHFIRPSTSVRRSAIGELSKVLLSYSFTYSLIGCRLIPKAGDCLHSSVIGTCRHQVYRQNMATSQLNVYLRTPKSGIYYVHFLWKTCPFVLVPLTRIDESLNRMPINITINVQHKNRSKCFWTVLDGGFHIVFYVTASNFFCYQTLGFSVERVGRQHSLSLLHPALPFCPLLGQHSLKILYKNKNDCLQVRRKRFCD